MTAGHGIAHSEQSPGRAPALIHGAQLVGLPLESEFEYALPASSGATEVEDAPLERGPMLYLGTGRRGTSWAPATRRSPRTIASVPSSATTASGWPPHRCRSRRAAENGDPGMTNGRRRCCRA